MKITGLKPVFLCPMVFDPLVRSFPELFWLIRNPVLILSSCGTVSLGNRRFEIFSIDRDEAMQIWVDADACPKAVKDILFRAATRTETTITLVANQYLQIPPSRHIKFLQVKSGFDVADNEIVKRLNAGDLVITNDIPLASEVIDQGGHALNPRGERYTQDNIRERLNMRDFMDTLRASGIDTGGPSALNSRDIQAFANQLDRFLAHQSRKKPL
jgi:uncharacterized protein YaiI (UPF0178 family)